LYGISLPDDGYFQLSDNISIVHTNFLLKSKYGKESPFIEKVRNNDSTFQVDHFFIIYTNIKAINESKARIILNDKFDQLLNAILYCCGIKNEENEKISLQKIYSDKNSLLIDQNNIKYSQCSSNDLINPLYNLSESIFQIDGNKKELFRYIDEDDLSHIERKIKIAVNWVGKSLKNNHISKSFLYLCIALETLLSDEESGPINSSTLYRISERVALLTRTLYDERLKVFNETKALYGKRSSLVHSGKSSVSIKDYYNLLRSIKLTIARLIELKNDNDKQIKTKEALEEWFNKIKFG
jgi:hypothetical protein